MTHRIDHPPVMWHYIKKWVRRRARRSLFIIFKWCWLLTCLNAFFRFSVLKFQRVWRWLTLKDRFVLYTSNMNVYTCIQLQHASQNTDEKMKQEKQNKTHNRRQKYWKTTVRFLTQQNAQSGDFLLFQYWKFKLLKFASKKNPQVFHIEFIFRKLRLLFVL